VFKNVVRAAKHGANSIEAGKPCLRLKPMPASDSHVGLLGFWQLGLAGQDDTAFSKLRLRSVTVASGTGKTGKLELAGKFADAPNLRLIGRRVKPRKASAEKADAAPSWRYLVGAVEDGSTKVRVFEAELFIIERDPESFVHVEAINNYATEPIDGAVMDAEDAEGDAPGAKNGLEAYQEARNKATMAYGTAAKKRIKRSEASRQVTSAQVDDVIDKDDLANLRKNAVQHTSAVISLRDQEIAALREILPPFSMEANNPGDIYDLESVVTDAQLSEQEATQEGGFAYAFDQGGAILAKLLQQPVGEVLQKSRNWLLETCKSPLVYVVVIARAEGGAREKSPESAARLVKRLGFLHCLVTLFMKRRSRDGVMKVKDLVRIFPIPMKSQLFHHLIDYFCVPVRDRGERKVHDRKVFCHALVWALYMTPGFAINAAPLVEETKMDVAELRCHLKSVGCRVGATNEADRIPAFLTAPLKIDEGLRPMRKKRRT